MVTAQGVYLHDSCFCCSACNEHLLGNRYYLCEGDKAMYCGRCHAEKFAPRCAGCDELILAEEYTKAEDKCWHIEHFCCWECDEDLCGKPYTKTDANNPVCIPCFNTKLADECSACHSKILVSEVGVEVR